MNKVQFLGLLGLTLSINAILYTAAQQSAEDQQIIDELCGLIDTGNSTQVENFLIDNNINTANPGIVNGFSPKVLSASSIPVSNDNGNGAALCTPLLFAIWKCHPINNISSNDQDANPSLEDLRSTIALLMHAGADINLSCSNGLTPIIMAIIVASYTGDNTIIQIILSHEYDAHNNFETNRCIALAEAINVYGRFEEESDNFEENILNLIDFLLSNNIDASNEEVQTAINDLWDENKKITIEELLEHYPYSTIPGRTRFKFED